MLHAVPAYTGQYDSRQVQLSYPAALPQAAAPAALLVHALTRRLQSAAAAHACRSSPAANQAL